MQFESQPSRFAVLPSSHCSESLRTPSPHTTFWHFASHPGPGGSQVSGATTHPSPHVLPLHTFPTQMSLPPHEAHCASTGPAAHFFPAPPDGPLTIVHTCGAALQTSAPEQTLGEFGVDAQEKVQSGSQPDPCTLPAEPKSHSSPGSTVPLPQLGVTQSWPVQVPPTGQAVPAVGGGRPRNAARGTRPS